MVAERGRIRKQYIIVLMLFVGYAHGENAQSCEERFPKRHFSFENRSNCWIKIITTNNREITLRPHDYEWTGFVIGQEPVTIVAQVDQNTIIHETFSRERDDEYKWIIDVYVPILRIVISRLTEHF